MRTLDLNCPRCGEAATFRVYGADVDVLSTRIGMGTDEMVIGLTARADLRATHSC